MRIVSYNILNGGEGRADPIAETLQAQNADVIALIEADNLDVIERIARRLGMDFVRGQGPGEHAAAIVSHWPIIHSINHAALRGAPQSLLEAVLQEPDGPQWTVAALHLHPRAFEADEAIREQELQVVLDVFAGRRNTSQPHLLCGDFNANSPLQRIDPAACKPATRQAWADNGGQIPRRVVQRLLDAGYVDTLHAIQGDQAATATTFTTLHCGQRIDYGFTWGIPRDRLRSAWIEKDRLARYASDHFPIGLEVAGV